MTENKRIGIFGGTFNPVHKGHLITAETFIEKLNLDILYVIPNNVPPMKETGSVSCEDRKNMLEIAFSHNKKVIVSDIEINREGTSYTCDTIALLREIHPDDRLFFLTGDDWADRFHKWKNFRYILDNVTLVIASRSDRDVTSALDTLEALAGKRPLLLENKAYVASSSQFRTEKKASLLPDGVYEYIKQRRLYGI